MTEYNSDIAEKSLEAKLAEMTRRAEKAEAEVVRLNKMIDWLVVKTIRFDTTRSTWSGPDDGLWMTAHNSEKTAIEAWKEAARKVVAQSEDA